MANDELPRNPAEAMRKVLVERYGSERVDHEAFDAAVALCEGRPMTPLERAARALEVELSEILEDAGTPDRHVARVMPRAVRAVLAAIREPSGKLAELIDDNGAPDNARQLWAAWIDAMLAEEG